MGRPSSFRLTRHPAEGSIRQHTEPRYSRSVQRARPQGTRLRRIHAPAGCRPRRRGKRGGYCPRPGAVAPPPWPRVLRARLGHCAGSRTSPWDLLDRFSTEVSLRDPHRPHVGSGMYRGATVRERSGASASTLVNPATGDAFLPDPDPPGRLERRCTYAPTACVSPVRSFTGSIQADTQAIKPGSSGAAVR